MTTKECVVQKLESDLTEAVWYYPEKGFFLFEDKIVDTVSILGLIRDQKLLYKGFKKHQGIQMIKYMLN
jgi:hypothetical protein